MSFQRYQGATSYLIDSLWRRLPVVPPARAGQDRVRRLLAELGSPQRRFSVLHVTGTTGKGSVAVVAAAILRAAGFRTGLYTSPYLQTFIERIAVDGRLIDPDEFADRVEALKPLAHQMHLEVLEQIGWGRPTLLELAFAVALGHFADQSVEVAVVEAGVGGLLDHTNVFEPPAAVLVTNVDRDHLEQLGGSLSSIARHKAALIKPGSRAVTGANGAGLAVIRDRAAAVGSPLWCLGSTAARGEVAVRVEAVGLEGTRFSVHTPCRRLTGLWSPLLGRHQARNAALAVAAVDALGAAGALPRPVPDGAVRRGVAEAWLPGRLEVVGHRPWVVLDAAHNPAAAAALRRALVEVFRPHYDRLVLVVGILADKDRPGILRRLTPLADQLVVTRPPFPERAGDPADTLEMARPYLRGEAEATLEPEPEEALGRALSLAGPEDLVCVTGSVYLVGLLRGRWWPEEAILAGRAVPRMEPATAGASRRGNLPC